MAIEADIWQPRTIVEAQANTKSVEQRIVASDSQSLFALTLFTYTVGTGALEVYKNGLRLSRGVDYIEQTSTTFFLAVPATVGDVILAQGFVGISGTVSTLDTDIYEINRQALRDYAGTETTLYNLGHTAANDGGAEFFQFVSGAAPATYVDNNFNTIVPTSGDGSSAWLMKKKPFYDVREAGAKVNGVTDDQTAITNTVTAAKAAGAAVYIPKGSINYGGTVYPIEGPFLWFDQDFSSGVNPVTTARNTRILITTETSTDAVYDTTKNRIGMSITSVARGGQHATAYRGTTNNYSTDGGGCTVFYGEARSTPGTWWVAALHGETRHDGGTSLGVSAECATYSTLGNVYGITINNTTNGGPTIHPLTSAAKADHPTSTGIYIQGSADVNNMGAWKYGIHFDINSIKTGGPSGRGEAIRFATAGAEHLMRGTVGAVTNTSDILLQAPSPVGIILSGAYTLAAIRINNDNYFSWTTNHTIQTRWNTANTAFEFENTGVLRAAIDLSATPHYDLAGVQVVGTRKTGWALATVTVLQLAQRVKALIDDLHATAGHGLIGT